MTAFQRAAARALALAACVLLLAGCGAEGSAETLSGRVVHVKDGDSLVLLVDQREVEVRLAEVDAPERGQPWANRSRQALSALVFGKTATAEVTDVDRYGRKVARLVVDGRDVASEMVRSGEAWVYRQYVQRRELLELEHEAQEARRGLWGLPEAERTPPWEWRRAQREATGMGIPEEAAKPPPPVRLPAGPAESAGFRCGAKTECREMTSCAEARFHLETCGLRGIDGDGDGRPCEKLCGH